MNENYKRLLHLFLINLAGCLLAYYLYDIETVLEVLLMSIPINLAFLFYVFSRWSLWS